MAFKNLISSLFGRKQEDTVPGSADLDPGSLCVNLAAALPATLTYEWDDRFDGILAAFEVGSKEVIFETLSSQFGQSWDHASIGSAPSSIKSAAKEFGGLAPEQLMFACGLTQEIILLGLWWPWGNGATISIRLIPYSTGAADKALDEVRASLGSAFGL